MRWGEADRGGSLHPFQGHERLQLPSGSTCQTLSLPTHEYGIPAGEDILLGGKVFSKAVLYGRRFSPTRAPFMFKTCFGWVLNDEINGESQQRSAVICITLSGRIKEADCVANVM